MRTATIREAQHNFSALIRHVQRGEEVEVLSRKTPVARIVPAKGAALIPGRVNWSGHGMKLKKLWRGKGAAGTPTEVLLSELRGER